MRARNPRPARRARGCPTNVEALARKFKNDKNIGFGCVGAAKRLPSSCKALVLWRCRRSSPSRAANARGLRASRAVWRSRRRRWPRLWTMSLADRAKFTKASGDGLPELEPPYLLGEEEEKDEVWRVSLPSVGCRAKEGRENNGFALKQSITTAAAGTRAQHTRCKTTSTPRRSVSFPLDRRRLVLAALLVHVGGCLHGEAPHIWASR